MAAGHNYDTHDFLLDRDHADSCNLDDVTENPCHSSLPEVKEPLNFSNDDFNDVLSTLDDRSEDVSTPYSPSLRGFPESSSFDNLFCDPELYSGLKGFPESSSFENLLCDPELYSGLCIPSDSMHDLEWFPSFSDNPISLSPLDFDQKYEQKVDKRVPLNDIGSRQQNIYITKTRTEFTDSRVTSLRCLPLSSAENENPSDGSQNNSSAIGRRCAHCQAEKTPQWRMGPKGPKTLCNACGIQYKFGWLVPEYRPVASPTFNSLVHSNSHKKMMKLRKLQ